MRDAECGVVLKHERAVGNLFQSFLLRLVFVDPVQNKAFLGNSLTMMPGDTQSSALPIAADATVGTCQNCAVLHQVKSPIYCPDFSVIVTFKRCPAIYWNLLCFSEFNNLCVSFISEPERICFVIFSTETEDSCFRVSVDMKCCHCDGDDAFMFHNKSFKRRNFVTIYFVVTYFVTLLRFL